MKEQRLWEITFICSTECKGTENINPTPTPRDLDIFIVLNFIEERAQNDTYGGRLKTNPLFIIVKDEQTPTAAGLGLCAHHEV